MPFYLFITFEVGRATLRVSEVGAAPQPGGERLADLPATRQRPVQSNAPRALGQTTLVQRGDARVQPECRPLRVRRTRRGAPLGTMAEEELRRMRQQCLQR